MGTTMTVYDNTRIWIAAYKVYSPSLCWAQAFESEAVHIYANLNVILYILYELFQVGSQGSDSK